MSTGLIALLDDVVSLAKVAAASLDDAAAQAAKAGTKAAGVVVDDAAVTPRYVVGFAAERELPIIGKIALGSLKNKLLYLLPAALVLDLVAPVAITPLLMLGGAFLCYEGAEKVYELVAPHAEESDEPQDVEDLKAFEDSKVRGAIQTDFILSAEIMAITLSNVAELSFWAQASVLAIVGIGITALVYGAVALIVKADDVGVALARNDRPVTSLFRRDASAREPSGADRALRPLTRTLGRGLVKGMPVFLKILSLVGTAAMLWVGGGIVIHGLAQFGATAPEHLIHDLAVAAAHRFAGAAAFLEWLVTAALSGLIGLVLGALIVPVAHYAIGPAIAAVTGKKPSP